MAVKINLTTVLVAVAALSGVSSLPLMDEPLSVGELHDLLGASDGGSGDLEELMPVRVRRGFVEEQERVNRQKRNWLMEQFDRINSVEDNVDDHMSRSGYDGEEVDNSKRNLFIGVLAAFAVGAAAGLTYYLIVRKKPTTRPSLE